MTKTKMKTRTTKNVAQPTPLQSKAFRVRAALEMLLFALELDPNDPDAGWVQISEAFSKLMKEANEELDAISDSIDQMAQPIASKNIH